MLNFDSSHNVIIGNINNNRNKFRIRNIIVNGILISSIFLFSGCQRNKEKDIFYAYNRINEESYYELAISNNLQEKATDSTISYIKIDDEEKKLIDFENEEGLFRIALNINKIKEITSSHNEHMEYEYEFFWKQKVEHFKDGEKIATSYVPKTEYLWTTDANRKDLTGKSRLVRYGYYGYKVVLDDKGNYKAIKSEMVDNIDDLPDEYVYVKSSFYEKIISNTNDLEQTNNEDVYEKAEVPSENKPNEFENKIKLNRM